MLKLVCTNIFYYSAEMKEAERRHPGQFAVEYYVVIARSHLVSMPKLKMGKKRKKKAASEASNAAPSSSTDQPIFDFYENELIHRVTASNFVFHSMIAWS